MESKVYDLVKHNASGKCERLRIKDALYLQFEDETEIERLISENFQDEEFFKQNNITVDPEMKGVAELIPALKKSVSMVNKTSNMDLNSNEGSEDKHNDSNSKVIKALQDVSFSARSEPPKDFFFSYAKPSICFPLFLAYLALIVFIYTMNGIFES